MSISRINTATAEAATAALKLDYLSSGQLTSKPASWWHQVLGVVGFETVPALHGLPIPVAASMTPTLGSGGDLCEVWRVEGQAVRLSTGAATYGRVQYRFCDELMFGSVCIEEREMENPGRDSGRGSSLSESAALLRATETAYQEIFAVLKQTQHRHLLRIWNYLPEINGEADGDERYRHFNSARQLAFRNSGRATVGTVPAACALGSPAGSPIWIYFLAARQTPTMIENPRQTSAYHYPPQFGRHSPIFSRACVLSESPGTNLFVSGTSSIVGHETLHAGNVVAQTEETMTNIGALLRECNRAIGSMRYGLDLLKYKVYVRRPADFGLVKSTLEGFVKPATSVLYLQADVCREDLLVEIEATGESVDH